MPVDMNYFQYLAATTAIIMGCLTMSACSPTIAKRGNMVDDDMLKQVQVGVSTREEVAKLLGTPTQMATFDDKIWYYIGRRTSQTAFFDPDLEEQKIVAVKFTPEGKVEKISTGGDKYAMDVSPVDAKTPTFGKEVSVVQQLLGNLGKPSIPKDNKNH